MNKISGVGFLILIAVLAILGLYGCYYYFLVQGFSEANQQGLVGVRAGTFGDAFGTLNALFSALACCGVVATLLLQRRDLKQTHEKADRQQFESHFYSRLSLQQNIVDRLDLVNKESKQTVATGRDCLKQIYKSMSERCLGDTKRTDQKTKIDYWYDWVWVNFHSDLGLYFRSLYSLLKFLSESEYQDKAKLGVVIRSLLSDYELAIILYNCMSSREKISKNMQKSTHCLIIWISTY
ncbi:putative phage abortive infection protein [Pseudomonas sp. NMS19W]|uniref:putative phage abortive infection protein n=1 Tax=Pseudomonas sp. NMS19W TaxID=3079768 RepID=UPI003F65F5DB